MINITYFALYFALYFGLFAIFQKYKRNETIAAYAVSMITCWNFVINDNYDQLESYYWYDIILSVYKRDLLMFAHHCLVIYALYRNTPDSHISILLLKYSKFSDLFAHINKILQSFEINTCFIIDIRLFTTLLTIFLWFIFRIGFIVYVCNQVVLVESQLVLGMFSGFTIWWMYKLCGIAYRLAYYE